MKILLADDDDGTRELVKRALQSDGHTVVAVSDGAAASDEVEADAGGYDLLIADVDMPGLDGISLAKMARQAASAIAVILISAHEAQLVRSAEISGAKVETLGKPFPLETLRATVAKVSA